MPLPKFLQDAPPRPSRFNNAQDESVWLLRSIRSMLIFLTLLSTIGIVVGAIAVVAAHGS